MHRYLIFILFIVIIEHASASCPAYDRNDYPHCTDMDRDCQDTRQQILFEENLGSIQFNSSKKCRVLKGLWFNSFKGREFEEHGKLDVDHIVPLKEANQSGAFSLSSAKRKDFADEFNGSHHLSAMSSSVNLSKGVEGPVERIPPNQKFWREYVKGWVQIKIRWDLKADEEELKTLIKILGPESKLPKKLPEKNCTKKASTKKKVYLTETSFCCGEKDIAKKWNSARKHCFIFNSAKRKASTLTGMGFPVRKCVGKLEKKMY